MSNCFLSSFYLVFGNHISCLHFHILILSHTYPRNVRNVFGESSAYLSSRDELITCLVDWRDGWDVLYVIFLIESSGNISTEVLSWDNEPLGVGLVEPQSWVRNLDSFHRLELILFGFSNRYVMWLVRVKRNVSLTYVAHVVLVDLVRVCNFLRLFVGFRNWKWVQRLILWLI